MTRHKPSVPALIMYSIISLSAMVAAVGFFLYYAHIFPHTAVMWTSVVFFTIWYHLQMRLLFGNVSKLMKFRTESFIFRERKFEKKLYKFLRVKKWKGKALTYNPELYDVSTRTLYEIVSQTMKAEGDHWVNIIIAFSTAVFGIIWGNLWIFLLSAVLVALFDMQFIFIQRYNHPRLMRLMKKQKKASDTKR